MKPLPSLLLASLLLSGTLSSALAARIRPEDAINARRGNYGRTSDDPASLTGRAQSSSSSVISWKTFHLRLLTFDSPAGWLTPSEGGESATLENRMEVASPYTRIFVGTEAAPWELGAAELDARFTRYVTNEGDRGPGYLPSYAPTDASDALLLGFPARRYTYTAEWQSKPIRGESVYASRGNKVYYVTIYAAPEAFQKDRAVFDRVVQSLAFKTGSSSSRSSLSSSRSLAPGRRAVSSRSSSLRPPSSSSVGIGRAVQRKKERMQKRQEQRP